MAWESIRCGWWWWWWVGEERGGKLGRRLKERAVKREGELAMELVGVACI